MLLGDLDATGGRPRFGLPSTPRPTPAPPPEECFDCCQPASGIVIYTGLEGTWNEVPVCKSCMDEWDANDVDSECTACGFHVCECTAREKIDRISEVFNQVAHDDRCRCEACYLRAIERESARLFDPQPVVVEAPEPECDCDDCVSEWAAEQPPQPPKPRASLQPPPGVVFSAEVDMEPTEPAELSPEDREYLRRRAAVGEPFDVYLLSEPGQRWVAHQIRGRQRFAYFPASTLPPASEPEPPQLVDD